MRAIDVVDEMREFVVRDGALIIFEDAPFWLAAEDADVIRSLARNRKGRDAGY